MSWMTWDIIRALVNMIPTNMEVPHTGWGDWYTCSSPSPVYWLPTTVIWYLVDVGSKWTKPSHHHTQTSTQTTAALTFLATLAPQSFEFLPPFLAALTWWLWKQVQVHSKNKPSKKEFEEQRMCCVICRGWWRCVTSNLVTTCKVKHRMGACGQTNTEYDLAEDFRIE